ncbi:unnamed protein product [Brassica rapa subsp. narinosa]
MRSFSVSVVTVHPSLAPAIVPLLLASRQFYMSYEDSCLTASPEPAL